jgi:3-deoxy-D-manno-octulosonic acid kinase
MTTELYQGYRLRTAAPWSDEAKHQLLEVLQCARRKGDGGLGGRRQIIPAQIDGIGRVIVKQYTRGGVFRHFVAERYLRWGPTRPEAEFAILDEVRAFGGMAPEPLASIDRGGPFYRAWLVTREIEQHATLAELSRHDDDRVRLLLDEVVRQISILIEQRILHVDLHPGNVVIDAFNKVYLLDFDRAYRYQGGGNRLRDRYLHRWRRAVIKHGLPDVLAEYVCMGLRRDFTAVAQGMGSP